MINVYQMHWNSYTLIYSTLCIITYWPSHVHKWDNLTTAHWSELWLVYINEARNHTHQLWMGSSFSLLEFQSTQSVSEMSHCIIPRVQRFYQAQWLSFLEAQAIVESVIDMDDNHSGVHCHTYIYHISCETYKEIISQACYVLIFKCVTLQRTKPHWNLRLLKT